MTITEHHTLMVSTQITLNGFLLKFTNSLTTTIVSMHATLTMGTPYHYERIDNGLGS